MTGFLGTLIGRYQGQLARNRNRPFLRAAMAASALVATADGRITFSERMRMDQILENLEALKVFDPHEGVNLFNEFADALLEDPGAGHETALAAIEPLARDAETAALVLRVCLAISAADGEVSDKEQAEILALCARLGVDPKDCGLFIGGAEGVSDAAPGG